MEQKKANKILQDKDREGMHQYRKKIKKLMYVYNVLPKKIQKMIDFNKTELNNQQKRLGNWHDNYAAINYFSDEHIPLETSEYFQKLKKREERQFNALYNSLSNKLK
ncbi:MAG: CHAD domain-containing protein [Saprospiraceae bacterium]|nr:CHAD domain-containing protein [Saprospiraceae bacterium]